MAYVLTLPNRCSRLLLQEVVIFYTLGLISYILLSICLIMRICALVLILYYYIWLDIHFPLQFLSSFFAFWKQYFPIANQFCNFIATISFNLNSLVLHLRSPKLPKKLPYLIKLEVAMLECLLTSKYVSNYRISLILFWCSVIAIINSSIYHCYPQTPICCLNQCYIST